MKKLLALAVITQLVFILAACTGESAKKSVVAFVDQEGKVDVMVNDQLFTSFVYGESMQGKVVTKPLLFPVLTPAGIKVNRSFPFAEVEGESPDHPHHTGIFFTYDQVNGSGFWNNTQFPPHITGVEFLQKEGGETGTLKIKALWKDENDVALLQEDRTMKFVPGDNQTTIDFSISLTAMVDKVVFADTKEGMFGIRVAHQLRENDQSGHYLSSNGDEGEKNVWGKRANWVKLEGQIAGKDVGVAIINHPTSTNFPTYWHARSYGLFAANPLGQFVFQKSRKEENPEKFELTLEKGKSAPFNFRVVIYDGPRTKEQLDECFADYTK
jgi:hypothetical protein